MVKKVDRQTDDRQDIPEEHQKELEIDRDTGRSRTLHRLHDLADRERSPSGGDDIDDADRYLAKEVGGEEAVDGTTSTPDQNMVEELAASAGIEIPDKYSLHTTGMLEQRDCHRWELEVESSEDYEERLD